GVDGLDECPDQKNEAKKRPAATNKPRDAIPSTAARLTFVSLIGDSDAGVQTLLATLKQNDEIECGERGPTGEARRSDAATTEGSRIDEVRGRIAPRALQVRGHYRHQRDGRTFPYFVSP